MAVDYFDGSELFARVARELAEQVDLPQTLKRICELAAQLTGASTVAIWSLSPGGRVTVQASTDEQTGRSLDHILRMVGEGVACEVLASRGQITMTDRRAETRWPRYRAALEDRRLGICSALGFSLELAGRQLGALVLYSSQPHYFTDQVRQVASVLAEHASIALDAAIATNQNQNLQQALQSNRRIGMAMGILIALHHLEERQAFDLLRVASQNTHTKLRDVAEEVILTGAVPACQVRQPA